jgi:hypothetical protein
MILHRQGTFSEIGSPCNPHYRAGESTGTPLPTRSLKLSVDMGTGDRLRGQDPTAGTSCEDATEMTVVELTQCGAQCRDAGGVDQRVEIDLVEPVEIGDRLLVRAGVAIANRGGQRA